MYLIMKGQLQEPIIVIRSVQLSALFWSTGSTSSCAHPSFDIVTERKEKKLPLKHQ